jgi:hypothetical protein
MSRISRKEVGENRARAIVEGHETYLGNCKKHNVTPKRTKGQACVLCYKERYQANSIKINEEHKKYYHENKEQICIERRKQRHDDPEKFNSRYRKWRKNNETEQNQKQLKWRLKNIKKNIIYSARMRAKEKNLEFSIAEEDIILIERCPIFDIPIFYGVGGVTDNSPSLDRIDNSKGYVKENVQVISKKGNTCKSSQTVEELIKFSNWIISTFVNK